MCFARSDGHPSETIEPIPIAPIYERKRPNRTNRKRGRHTYYNEAAYICSYSACMASNQTMRDPANVQDLKLFVRELKTKYQSNTIEACLKKMHYRQSNRAERALNGVEQASNNVEQRQTKWVLCC